MQLNRVEMILKNIIVLTVLHFCFARHLQAESGSSRRHVPAKLNIINGHDVLPHTLPSIVLITVADGGKGLYCGGTLIHKEFVLTAAHCLYGPKKRATYVYLGLNRYDKRDAVQWRRVNVSVVHEKYAAKYKTHDVALIKLEFPIVLQPGTVELGRLEEPVTFSTSEDAYVDRLGDVLGWGFTEQQPPKIPQVLQGLEVRVRSRAECPRKSTTEGTLCVSRSGGGRGVACSGDSGGPLLLNGVQVGVNAAINGSKCEKSWFMYAARVGYHRQWIDDKIKTM